MVVVDLSTRIKMASFGPVVLSYGDSLIRQSEMDILGNPNEWLNDVLISFSLEYMETTCRPPFKDHVKFYAATLSQFIKLCDRHEEIAAFFVDTNLAKVQYAFWPINDGSSVVEASGSHWSLLVYSRPDDAFVHFDSVKTSCNVREASVIYERLKLVFSRSAGFVSMPTHQQINATDCGLHVLANAAHILRIVGKRWDTNQKFSQITSRGCEVPTVDADGARRLRNGLLGLIQNLATPSQQVSVSQAPMPQLSSPQAPMPRLPASQAPMPRLLAPQAPMPRLPAPQLPAPQVSGQPVENVQRNLSNLRLD